MNYYPFHIGDYVSDTRHLTWLEDAAYRRLLDVYYTKECPLPADERQVFRLVTANTEEQREATITVLNEFFELTENGWENARANTELQTMQHKRQCQKEKAEKRWHSHSKERGIASERNAALPQHGKVNATAYATASKHDANAMPPTPTPSPVIDNKNNNAQKRRVAASAACVCPDGVRQETWGAFMEIRKAKRAPMSQAALDLIASEAAKAGMTLEAALSECVLRGWQGFKAEWVQRGQPALQRSSTWSLPSDDEAEAKKWEACRPTFTEEEAAEIDRQMEEAAQKERAKNV